MPLQAATLMRRCFEEVWNRGNLGYIDERFARDWVGHLGEEVLDGPESLKRYVASLRGEHPDMRFTVKDVVAEGDRVAVRWKTRGGARATTGMTFARLADGKIVESWTESATLAVL